jgi:hypothetical protein
MMVFRSALSMSKPKEQTHYEVLGVSNQASKLRSRLVSPSYSAAFSDPILLAAVEEIKKAYRAQALAVHPDRQPPAQREAAGVAFKRVATAWLVLSDAALRAEYDRSLLCMFFPLLSAASSSPLLTWSCYAQLTARLQRPKQAMECPSPMRWIWRKCCTAPRRLPPLLLLPPPAPLPPLQPLPTQRARLPAAALPQQMQVSRVGCTLGRVDAAISL